MSIVNTENNLQDINEKSFFFFRRNKKSVDTITPQTHTWIQDKQNLHVYVDHLSQSR